MKTKKTVFSSQKFYDIRCESTKITKIRAENPNLGVLGLDLHFSSPEPVNFFGAQSSLGGHNFRLGWHKKSFGGHGPGMPPSGPGPASILDLIHFVLYISLLYFARGD